MGPTRVRRVLRRIRRPAVIAVLTATFAAAVTAHHSSPSHHGGTDHDMGASSAMEFCVAVFAAVGSAVVAVALGLLRLGRRYPITLIPVGVVMATRPPVPGARAGPDHLRLCVLLR